MKLREAFAKRTYDKRPKSPALVAAHEDDVSMTLTSFVAPGPHNGQVPVYIYYSPDDESYFFSGKPITSDRIHKELGDGFIGLEYADAGEGE